MRSWRSIGSITINFKPWAMTGTIVNAITIVVGSVVGSLANRGLKDKYKQVLYTGLGLASFGIGLNAFISYMPKSEYPVLFIASIAIGGVIGTALNLDARFKHIVEGRSKKKKQMAADADPRSNLAEGLSTAILLYCIGPLSMLGPVISALNGDNTFLYTNATLDLVSSFVFATTYGIGMILAAPVLFIWQGTFFLIAKISSEAVSDSLMAELLIVGGLLITCSGLTLLKIKDCKTLNLLPSLLVPVVWYLLKGLI